MSDPIDREVELPGRGRISIREMAGPTGVPDVVLLQAAVWREARSRGFDLKILDISRYFP